MTVTVSIEQLSPLGGTYVEAIPTAINNNGQVVGVSFPSGGSIYNYQAVEQAVIWQNGSVTDIGTLPGYGVGSYATGINDAGQVIGISYSSTDARHTHSFVWQNGTLTDLGSNGGPGTFAYKINNAGQIFGTSTGSTGLADDFVWQNGSMSVLPSTVPDGTVSAAYPILIGGANDQGAVVGSVYVSGSETDGYLWQNGTATNLGNGGIQVADIDVNPRAINDAGQIAGIIFEGFGVGAPVAAFSWQGGKMTVLPSLAGGNAEALNENASGVIVGESTASGTGASAVWHAVIWENGAVIDLNSLLPANSGWVLTAAQAINDKGEIVGIGTYNGTSAAFELTLPVAPYVASVAVAGYKAGTLPASIAVTDSAVNVQADLDGLQSIAAAGKLVSITLTDGGIPTLSITSAQLAGDQAALSDISSSYQLQVTAPAAGGSITGQAGHAEIVAFSGAAASYTVTADGTGTGFKLSDGTVTDHLSGITALKFSDYTDFVASQTPGTAGGVSSAQIANLYSAVFARTPDSAGLAYYEAEAAANPGQPITAYAQNFLSSPEYTANSAHAYSQDSAGDAKFITDTYQNLLHRAPGGTDVAWYQANVVAPYLAPFTAGTAAYAAAELQAHAAVLADFSQSGEFAGDVSITAAHPADAQHWLILI